MIGIVGNKAGEFRAFINIAEEDVKDAVIVEGAEEAVEFLGGLYVLSSDAAGRMESLLTKIYEMGYERGKADGAKAQKHTPTIQGPSLGMRR